MNGSVFRSCTAINPKTILLVKVIDYSQPIKIKKYIVLIFWTTGDFSPTAIFPAHLVWNVLLEKKSVYDFLTQIISDIHGFFQSTNLTIESENSLFGEVGSQREPATRSNRMITL